MTVAINNAWIVLKKYYSMADPNHSVYASATLLNPTLRERFFHENWTGEMSSYTCVMKDVVGPPGAPNIFHSRQQLGYLSKSEELSIRGCAAKATA